MRSRSELKLIPNVLSFSRLVLALGFVGAGAEGRVGLIGVAAATDFLDGWVARRVDAASRWGALIDPIADRVFVVVAVSTFLFNGALSTVGYFVMVFRDIATAIGFVVARVVPWLRPVELKARLGGKVVTVLQLMTLLALVLAPRSVTPLLACVAAASAWAIADYALALWRSRAA